MLRDWGLQSSPADSGFCPCALSGTGDCEGALCSTSQYAAAHLSCSRFAEVRIRIITADVGADHWAGGWMVKEHTLGYAASQGWKTKGHWQDLPGSITGGKRSGQHGTLTSRGQKDTWWQGNEMLLQTSGCQAMHMKGLTQGQMTAPKPHQTLGRAGCQ